MLKAALLALFSRKKRGSGKLDPFLASKPYFVDTVYDEQDDVTFQIKFACTCNNVVRKLDDGFFACDHCDRPCYAGNCTNCTVLYSLDLWNEDEER